MVDHVFKKLRANKWAQKSIYQPGKDLVNDAGEWVNGGVSERDRQWWVFKVWQSEQVKENEPLHSYLSRAGEEDS